MDRGFLLPKDFVATPACLSRSYAPPEAARYTRWLATHHYENFHVVSFLLPKRVHQDFFNVYAFCRWADDLGDEIGGREESRRLLDWWRRGVEEMYAGRATHPVYVALAETVERHQLPREPFLDLIHAFVQDQTVTRYRTWEELLDYCRYSANPVGRLVLHLCGYADAERQKLSDATCSGLQLANFWQDVSIDVGKGRIYIPLDLLDRHGCAVADVEKRRCTDGFRAAMQEAVGFARALLQEGLPLSRIVDRRLALDIELFSRGGLLILDKVETQAYDVLTRRPTISRTERGWLLLRTLARQFLAMAA